MTRSKIRIADKRQITSDWQQTIPSLGVYKPMHLLNRVGPLLVGVLLEVKSDNENYLPTFHVHNLLQSFPVVSLGLNYEASPITVAGHQSKHFGSAMDIINQAIIPLEGDLHLTTVLNAYEKYYKKNTGGYFHQYIFEDIVLLSAWCGDKQKIDKGLEFAENNMSQWPEHVLNRLGGLKKWLTTLEEKAQNQTELLTILESQIIELKVSHIPVRNLKCK
ncbi:hypothetical protein ACOJQI_15880 [Bacillus salacetis]|uniref:hypothetical protein n=1 Tax=Bacillus salacetis TaxID=2315464 RepID=UPI003B9F5BF0